MRRTLPEDPSDLVWLQTAFLGDMILTSAAIRLGMARFPDARHHLISTDLGCAALAGISGLASRIPFRKQQGIRGFLGVRPELRRQLADPGRAVLLQGHRSFRSGLLAMATGLPVVAFREADFQPLAARRVTRVAPLHEAARLALLLEPLGVPREEILACRPALQPLDLDLAVPWQKWLAGTRGPVVALSPGSVWGTKRWTAAGFADVGRRLASDGANVVLLGSQGERPLTDEVVGLMGAGDGIRNLAGETSLEDLQRIYPKLDLLVTNDSSPVHYASAFDVPTVVTFGATIPEMGFGPLARFSRTVGIELDCRPCSDHGPMTCPKGHFKCMKDLTPAAVYTACRGALKESGILA